MTTCAFYVDTSRSIIKIIMNNENDNVMNNNKVIND